MEKGPMPLFASAPSGRYDKRRRRTSGPFLFRKRQISLRDLTEFPFGEMVFKPCFSQDYGGTDDLGRNCRRQERSSPRGRNRSNLGCLDQEDLSDGRKGADPLPQNFQFDQI